MLALAVAAALLAMQMQGPLFPESAPPAKKAADVTYLFPEQVTIPAGKPTAVDLHFKVAPGLHVNSHSPKTDDLVPTNLQVPATSGVQLVHASYPTGVDYSFAESPQEKLSVYTGEFIVHASLAAPTGDHLVEGTLHYQACNNRACMPPQTIKVVIDVIAK